jgi:hypothetical protein
MHAVSSLSSAQLTFFIKTRGEEKEEEVIKRTKEVQESSKAWQRNVLKNSNKNS